MISIQRPALSLILCVLSLWSAAAVSAELPSPATQIAGAVLAAPEAQRAGAGVLGFDADGAMTLLRTGTNALLCLADDPAKDGFQVACYHRALEPFMARGRALKAEGVASGLERTTKRWQEVEAGELAMPEQPTTLHILQGKSFDPATGVVDTPYQRWVVYTPYATAETSGLPTTPVEGAPWLMMPGTPSAHIMISPPRPKSESASGSTGNPKSSGRNTSADSITFSMPSAKPRANLHHRPSHSTP